MLRVLIGLLSSGSPAFAQSSNGGTLPGWIGIGILLLIYLLPSIVAASRKHNNEGAIVALNLLLGWTGLGWIGALIWALTNNTRI